MPAAAAVKPAAGAAASMPAAGGTAGGISDVKVSPFLLSFFFSRCCSSFEFFFGTSHFCPDAGCCRCCQAHACLRGHRRGHLRRQSEFILAPFFLFLFCCCASFFNHITLFFCHVTNVFCQFIFFSSQLLPPMLPTPLPTKHDNLRSLPTKPTPRRSVCLTMLSLLGQPPCSQPMPSQVLTHRTQHVDS